MVEKTNSYMSLINSTGAFTSTPKQSNIKRPPIKTNKLTPANKKFVDVYAKTNNGTKAALEAFPHLTKGSAGVKANRMLNNDKIVNHIEYQRNKLEQLATKAVQRVESLIQSDNEMVASTNVWKTIEQVQGKAMQKSTNVNVNFTGHVNDKGSDYSI